MHSGKATADGDVVFFTSRTPPTACTHKKLHRNQLGGRGHNRRRVHGTGEGDDVAHVVCRVGGGGRVERCGGRRDLAGSPDQGREFRFSAGSRDDIIPRAVFEQMAVELGEPDRGKNRGGAGGTIGVGTVAKAEPTATTILANSSAHTIAPWIIPNLSYDTAHDLTAVIPFGKNANVLVVLPGKGWKTVQDLVAAAKRNPRQLQLRLGRRRHRDPYSAPSAFA